MMTSDDIRFQVQVMILTLLMLNTTCSVLVNSVDPDQLASKKPTDLYLHCFVIRYVNFYQKLGSSNLIGWKLEVGLASFFVLRFYGPDHPMGSCRARSVYLTTRLLGRLSPLSG